MRDSLRHRGPDDAGEWWSTDGCIGLGHRRLAIVDLSPAGHQPMHDASGELCVVFNGEIYNFVDLRRELAAEGHAFRSHSDTEVILAAYREWGTECLSRLNGTFAFALYDGRQRQLFMARDRAGEKPLFYALVNGTLRFASELKALMADPTMRRRIDPEALAACVAPFADPAVEMASLMTPLRDADEWRSPHVVKVVTDADDFALYFSRSPIPFWRGARVGAALGYRHLGLYAWRRATLLALAAAPRSRLECAEELEQLRALERGIRIKMVFVDSAGPEVDTAEDLERVRHLVEGEG